MNSMIARSHYRQAQAARPMHAETPHDVVLITLKELKRAMDVLAIAHAQARSLPTEHVNRALTAIYILQTSLDFEQGGEIATDLFQLYEFARFHVLAAWRNQPDARLAEAAEALANILEAWAAIGQNPAPALVAAE